MAYSSLFIKGILRKRNERRPDFPPITCIPYTGARPANGKIMCIDMTSFIAIAGVLHREAYLVS